MSDSINGLEQLRSDVLAGQITRRGVLKRGALLGLSAPIIASLLAACGDDDDDDGGEDAADATNTAPSSSGQATEASEEEESPEATEAMDEEEETPEAEATESGAGDEPAGEAGGGGLLRLLWWQAPTIINPHLAQGTKDFDASQVCLEPLANFDPDGNLVPFLAAEIPSLDNGLVAEDGLSVTWNLRQGVKWHDGENFTAEDVAFTFEFVSNEATTATTLASYSTIESVDVIDDHTVQINFKEPTPAWYDSFVGPNGMILPQHVFADYVGAEARNAPANLMPIGTGPFKVTEFRPGDVVLYDLNPDYWDAGKPFFDQVEMKGGGDSSSAARAVLESGEADWSWNVQVEPQILDQMAEGGEGVVVSGPGASAERLMMNFADPNTEVDGARSEPSTQHPIFQHKDVRNAVALAIQRDVIAEQLYGAGGVETSNNLNVPPAFVSPNTSWAYDLDAAAELLAGYPEADGYSILFQTSINSVRQKTQEIIKADLEQLGFQVELKSVDAAVFFASDAGNPDTFGHFYADIEMFTNGPSSPFPISWAQRYRSDDIASQENAWSGDNITRWNNPEFDKLHDEARTALDPDRQAELFIAMNDLTVNEFVEIPIIHRASVAAAAASLTGYKSATFMSDVWDIKDWRRDE